MQKGFEEPAHWLTCLSIYTSASECAIAWRLAQFELDCIERCFGECSFCTVCKSSQLRFTITSQRRSDQNSELQHPSVRTEQDERSLGYGATRCDHQEF